MASTATDPTREHYQRPEVKEIITRFAMPDNGMRALNGDFHRWYEYSQDGHARLLNIKDDYDMITDTYRVLYQTLNVFDPGLMAVSRKREEITSEEPLGTPADTQAYTLGCDIDKGAGCNIEDQDVKQAVEAAAQFLVDDLKKSGVHVSVWVLFSGGGIYIEIHHELCRPKTLEGRAEFFEMATDCFNAYLIYISNEFFKVHPEYIGKVKFDALNNSKRIFKCILSIHMRKPYAVTPLNRDAIEIDFDQARVPLSIEMIEEARRWYSSYDLAEREPFLKLLDQFREAKRESPSKHFDEIRRSPYKVELSDFPPCMKHIVETENRGEGKTRFTAILSAYLFQVGWDDEDAWDLIKSVSDRNGLDNADHIFDSCYGRISCPSCKTIQTDANGYPHLGLSGLGACKLDPGMCGKWPGDYGVDAFFRNMGEGQRTEQNGTDISLKDVAHIEYKPNGEYDTVRFSPTLAARVVLTRMPLRMSEDSEDIYRFNGQIYRPDGTREIDRVLCKAAEDHFTGDKLKETLRRIRNELAEAPARFDPNPYLLGVKNGVADLLTGQVREYTPGDLITDQIPVAFDPAARCPAFLEFLESITPNVSDRITLIDWFVATAIKEPFAYVLFLLGLGRNGKGIYEKLIKKFFGHAAFRDMPLAEVGRNNFAAGGFYKKRGWIASETGKRKASIGTDFIKLTSGNGVIDSDRKNQSRIQFEPYFQTIVDTNTMPPIDDNSKGWQERFVKVDLPYTFLQNPDPDNPLEKQRDPALFDKLTTENELSGILNLLLFRSQAIGKSGQIHKRAGAEMFAEYREQSTSVTTFLELFCEYEGALSSLWTPSKPIYEAYVEWCCYKVGEVVDKAYFGRQLKKICGGVAPRQGKDKDRKTQTEYKGLIYHQNKYQAALESLMSEVCPKMSEVVSEVDKSQQISMSEVSEVNVWNEIIERFGDPSKSKISPNKAEYEKIPRTLRTPRTSAAGEPVGEEPASDTPRTVPRTKPGISPHPRRSEPTAKEKVRILKPDGYRTQIQQPDNAKKWINHLYTCGELIEVEHWKAVDLIKKGIAEPVEAGA